MCPPWSRQGELICQKLGWLQPPQPPRWRRACMAKLFQVSNFLEWKENQSMKKITQRLYDFSSSQVFAHFKSSDLLQRNQCIKSNYLTKPVQLGIRLRLKKRAGNLGMKKTFFFQVESKGRCHNFSWVVEFASHGEYSMCLCTKT